jgi:hypothetical protein
LQGRRQGKAHAKTSDIFRHRHAENAGLGQFPDNFRVKVATGIPEFPGSSTSARPVEQSAYAFAQQAEIFLVAG